MKNIKNILQVSFALLLLIGCNDDEYEIPGEFVDLSLTFTSGAGTDRESQVNRFFSFSDISAGAEYQEWSIPDNAFFLEGPIPNNLDNHDEYIKEPREEKTSTDKTVHVLFKKGDTLTKIGYYAVFPDSTSFIFNSYYDSDLNSFVPDTVKTLNVNGKWVAEYEFTLDVYDTVVAKPEVRYTDGTILDHINTESITLTYGDKLVFEDLSNFVEDNNARPDETKWTVRTFEDNEDDRVSISVESQLREGDYEKKIIDTVTFNKLGDFKVSLKATRARTENLRVSTDTILMPVVIKVVPLAEDLVLQTDVDIEERDDDRIVIPVSSPLEAIEGNIGADFIVKVDGTEIPVESVSIGTRKVNGETVGGLLFITLDVPLEPADASKTVTVSYNGTSIMSKDERLLQAFTDEPIVVYVPTPMGQVGDVLESENDEIVIKFDQEIDATSIANSSNPGAGFMIEIDGVAATIESVSVNADNAKTLDIALVEDVSRLDVITIAYTGPGDIMSVGGGTIADFAPITVMMNEDDILNGEGDFEGDVAPNWTDANGNGTSTVTFVDPTPIVAPSGSKVAFFQAPDGNKPDLRSTITFPFEGGKTYILKYKRYITSATTTTTSKTYIGATQLASDQWAAAPRDVWVDYQIEYTHAGSGTSNETIRFQPVPAGVCEVYFDNLIVQEKEI
ncbi:hypothetical protein GCM10022291_00140 [Postechiella marina]|uniref:Uncharacterized protein n=1 Tax=Postechiella marina TaxID=943941 RepID=A0ABP8BZA3_9FLAO